MNERMLDLRAKLDATRSREAQSRESLHNRQAAVVEIQGSVDALRRRIEELTIEIEVLEQAERIVDEP